MGIRKYHNRWRAYIVDKQGVHHQKYFDTEQEAQQFYDKCYAGKMPNARYKKRCDAKAKDLPVGLLQTFERKYPVGGGETIYHLIKAVAVVNGKLTHFQRKFGENRTRKKAVELCLNWRIHQMKLNGMLNS